LLCSNSSSSCCHPLFHGTPLPKKPLISAIAMVSQKFWLNCGQWFLPWKCGWEMLMMI
jgi:hypothetical protein